MEGNPKHWPNVTEVVERSTQAWKTGGSAYLHRPNVTQVKGISKMIQENNPLPIIPATVKEAPLPEDLVVCAGCGGRTSKLSRDFYHCKFCGCRKAKRNPKRPQVCRGCIRTYCRYIPEGRTTCKKLVKPIKPASKTRLKTAGKGLNHICGECVFMPTIPDIIAAWNGKHTPACVGKKALSRACNKFVANPTPPFSREV